MAGRQSLVGQLMLLVAIMPLAGFAGSEAVISGDVRVLSAWTEQELDAFRAVVAPFEERTDVSIEYVTTRDLRGGLDKQLAAGTPPDIAGRYLVSDEAQTLWVAQGGSLSVKSTVTADPDPVTQRAAELLTGAEAFLFDASDQMPGDLNAAFWRAVMIYTEGQARLGDVLAELEMIRQGGSSSPT